MSDLNHLVYAVKYGELSRAYRDNFLASQPGDDRAVTMNYYIWAIVKDGACVVVDTGFSHIEGERRGRRMTRPIEEGLAALGVDPNEVSDVVLTHLHYDHAGRSDLFPNARFHIQRAEINFATGHAATHPQIGHHFAAADVGAVIALLYAGRLRIHDGDAAITAGISVHLIGGHTAGTQGVAVQTDRGTVFLASDSAHFYANYETRNAFPVIYNHLQLLDGYDRIKDIASSTDHVIPGHDALVLQRYPAPHDHLRGWVASLHETPKSDPA